MKRLSFSLFLILMVPLASATELDTVQAVRPKLKSFVESLLIRRLSQTLEQDMESKGLQRVQIVQVLSSPEFARYSKRVIDQPRVQVSIDRLLDRVVSRENLRNAIVDAQRQDIRSREMELAAFFQQILRDKSLEKNEIPDESGWVGFEALWNRIKGHLFD